MAQSAGEILKETRLGRGLTIEQVAQATRIRPHFLEALERGDKSALPSPVQARGFLRLYAGYLNLPEDALLAAWEGRSLPQAVEAAAPSGIPAPLPQPVAEEAEVVEQEGDEVEEVEEEPEPEPVRSVSLQGASAVFREIGVELRRQREALGLSLEDVEQYTRLRQRYLRAMESGHLDELPSTVQGRGMISNYATFLNLDAEGILLRYAEGLQQRRVERLPAAQETAPEGRGKTQPRGARPASAARRLLTPDLLVGAVLIVVFFIFIVWTAARIASSRNQQAQATLPSVADVLLATASPTFNGTPLQPTAASSVTPAPGGDLPAAGGDIQAAPTGTLPPINADPLQVYVVAKQRAFLQIVVDGQIKFNARVTPGVAYPFSGKQTITLVTGNGAALQVFFNQKDLGVIGIMGQVVRLTFTPQGVTTPTPLPTPTATATPPQTPTPAVSPTFFTPTVTPFIP